MSKKKIKKSNRVPAKKPYLSIVMQEAMAERRKIFDQAFQISCGRVREVLTRFHPGDALMAVNISDLWQPNRASQVKHLLAFSLLVSTPENSFSPARMTTYEEFSEFCAAMIEALPDVPMLEDYVPEEDWGEVKVLLGEEPVAILHGGPVQRVVDHIEAFRICHGNGTQAEARRQNLMRRVAPEVETIGQPVQFLDAEDNRLVRSIGRRFEALGFQALEPKAEAVALPVQDLHAVAGLVEENEKHRIEHGHFYIQLAQRGEAIDGLSKSTGLG